MKTFTGLALVAAAATAVSATPIVIDSIHAEAAPVLSASNAQEIADNYIVVFKKHVDQNLAALHHGWVEDIHSFSLQTPKTDLKKRSQATLSEEIYGGLKHTYNIAGTLLGYSGHFDEDVIEQIRRHPDVGSLSDRLGIDVASQVTHANTCQ